MKQMSAMLSAATLGLCVVVLAFTQSMSHVEAAPPPGKGWKKNMSSSSVSSVVSSVASSSSSISSSTSSSSSMSSVISSISSASSLSSILSSSSRSSSSNGRIWGAYVGDQLTDAAAFETLVGKSMNMQAIFMGGSDLFPSAFGTTVRDQGKTLVIFWEPTGVSLDAIISGSLDADVQRFAAGAQAYAGPVIFVPFHEMNGDWVTWGGTVGNNTPEKLIAAWKRVHGKFTGVTNVKFGWAVNSHSVPDIPSNAIANYYPGDAYVDYVGVDGFNFGDPWMTFSQVYDGALSVVEGYNKPVILFSMACAAGTQKAAWIPDALSTQLSAHPKIIGWIWFNVNKEKDWRVNSDPNSLSAFKAVLP